MKLLTTNTLMYLLIFLATIIVFRIEKSEWECVNPYEWWKPCKIDEGMPYRGSKPEPSDDCSILLNKINIAAGAEQASIKWRRAFILAVLTTLLSFVLVITPASLPEWNTFYVVVLIGWTVIYFNLNNYSYHKYNVPQDYITKSVELLREKGCV